MFCLVERVEFANIKNLKIVLDESYDMGAVTNAEVEIDDGETLRKAIHQWEQAWREAVDAREGKHAKRLTMLGEPRTTYILVGRLHLTRLNIRPSHQAHGIVEEQITLGLTTAHDEHRILIGQMLMRQPCIIDIIEDIDIVNKNGRIIMKQHLGLLECPTRLKQFIALIAEMYKGRIVLLGDMVDNLLGKMVHVDYKTVVALCHESANIQVEQWRASDRYQRLRHGIRQGLQSCAQACSQNHSLFHAE